MRSLVKSMAFCYGCERNQPIEHDSALRKWRYVYIRPRDNFFIATASAHPDDLSMSHIPYFAKLVCCAEGMSKLFSRWLNSGTIESPRGNVAEPVKLHGDQPDGFFTTKPAAEEKTEFQKFEDRVNEIVDAAQLPLPQEPRA